MKAVDRRTALRVGVLGALGFAGIPRAARGQAPAAPATPQPARGFTIEYYYKVRWGAFSEFRRLYAKNHLPLLRRYQARGYILAMSATIPMTHASESARWDMRFDITWRDAATALEPLPDAEAITRELYPDQATFEREEQRRFELLVEHMDLPVSRADLSTW
jgi:hypothetical protein